MDKSLKTIGLTALAFVAYRAYKLYELGNSFDWEFYGMKFQRPANWQDALNKYQVVLIFEVKNPTKTSLSMRGLEGSIREGGNLLGNFKTGNFTIKGGSTFINVVVDLDSKYVASTLIPSLLSRVSPKFDISLTTIFPFGIKYTQNFNIDAKEYIPKDFQSFFKL
jgi:hypothetical protein